MKPIPKQVEPSLVPGLTLSRRGKVCEIYHLPDSPHLLKVVSDRVSVHDIILPFHIPHKGEILNFIDHLWRQLFPNIRHDMVAIGPAIDPYLPKSLRGNADLQCRARVIKSCETLSAELIYRWLLTGTGLKRYQKDNGCVCGQKFPDGLKEWDELNPPAFTPTTKDPDGHDEHMSLQDFIMRFGQGPIDLTRPLFERGMNIAKDQKVIIADTKFEVGKDQDGRLTVIDEILTPDSSRFIDPDDLERARQTGKKPPSFDKQPIRDYVEEHLGVGAATPLTSEVIAKVHNHHYPDWLIEKTATRYEQLFKLLTGMWLVEHRLML